MPKDYELDRIKSEERAAFNRKQQAWNVYDEARKTADMAHNAMQSAWEERCSAREEMNREYEIMEESSNRYREVWDEYGNIRDRNNAEIESLRQEADYEHREMQRCFDQASNEYQYGDKAMAPTYSQEGHEHKNRRDELNARISELCREVKEAKQNAEWRAPKTDNSAFKSAKARFEQAKSHHESKESEFKRLKSERDHLKAEFDSAQNEHKRLKEEFQRRLEEVRAQRRNKKQQLADKVNTALVKTKPFHSGSIFGQNAKIVERRDGSGKTDVYFSGLAAAGDGIGHGHAVIDKDGNLTYLRDAWQDHKNYLINDRAKNGQPTNI